MAPHATYWAEPHCTAQRALGIAQAVTRHRPISKLKLKIESQTHGVGQMETKGQSLRCSSTVAERIAL